MMDRGLKNKERASEEGDEGAKRAQGEREAARGRRKGIKKGGSGRIRWDSGSERPREPKEVHDSLFCVVF